MTPIVPVTILSLVLAVGSAAEARAAPCTSYDDVLAAQKAHGALSVIIAPDRLQTVAADAERITGVHTNPPTRGFLLLGAGIAVLGLEVNGCLLDPVYVESGGKEVVA